MKITDISNDTLVSIRQIFAWSVGAIGVVEPLKIQENYRNFEWVIQKHRISYGIHYVMKCNQSCILPKIISDLGGRIDISSLGELHKAIALGIPSSRITANGPKNTEFLECCIAEEVCIIIDSLSELEQLLEIGSHLKKTPPILIRLSGFTEHRPSRFGVHKDLWGDCITLLEKSSTQIQYQGISFHIDSHDVESRKQVFWETQEFIRKASQKWCITKIIDIGWSYGIHPEDDRTTEERLCRTSEEYIFPIQDIVGEEFLDAVLSTPQDNHSPIGTYLRENGYTLWIEPGRSLLERVGYTATRIISLQYIPEPALVLDINSFGLGTRESEIPTNPLYLPLGDIPISLNTQEYTLLGNLCREKDRLLTRKIKLPNSLSIWDIIIFPDTAGYRMDFFETRSILHPFKSRYFQTSIWLQIDQS